ncbi:MAG: hypothetical protein AAB304_06340 [Pseudomonadota bacterium]
MKLLYSGEEFCDQPVLKRLLVVAEEIHFMDRPSVTFKNWGTVGHDSYARRIDWSGSPVLIDVFKPPSGPAHGLYGPYIEADINNPLFEQIVLEGFCASDEFARKFIQFGANYGNGTGEEIAISLRQDHDLLSGKFDLEMDGPNLFDVTTPERRKQTFKTILIEASIKVTSAIVLAEETNSIPVSDDPYIARLIGLRVSDSAYVGGTSKFAPYIGLDIAKSVIPDEALNNLKITQILDYREKTKDAYKAWITEVNKVSAEIGNIEGSISPDEISRIIATDFAPRIIEYKNEMSAVRDDLFADVMKKVATWEVPSLSLAYISSIGMAGSLALFAAALAPAIPDVIDYFKDKKDVDRRNAMSFLIKLSKDV